MGNVCYRGRLITTFNDAGVWRAEIWRDSLNANTGERSRPAVLMTRAYISEENALGAARQMIDERKGRESKPGATWCV